MPVQEGAVLNTVLGCQQHHRTGTSLKPVVPDYGFRALSPKTAATYQVSALGFMDAIAAKGLDAPTVPTASIAPAIPG